MTKARSSICSRVRGADPRCSRGAVWTHRRRHIHFNLELLEGADADWFLAQDHAIMDAVSAVVSAEHGLGRLEPCMMPKRQGGVELDPMRRVKTALDPAGIMNPGKVLP